MEKAYALRDAREKARQEYVQRRLNDQWRDSCDDARTLDSKAMTLYMNQERLRQIREKVERKQMLSQQEDNFLAEWNRQMEELEKRDREKEEYRRKVDKETSQAIRKQVRVSISFSNTFDVDFIFYNSDRRQRKDERELLQKYAS